MPRIQDCQRRGPDDRRRVAVAMVCAIPVVVVACGVALLGTLPRFDSATADRFAVILVSVGLSILYAYARRERLLRLSARLAFLVGGIAIGGIVWATYFGHDGAARIWAGVVSAGVGGIAVWDARRRAVAELERVSDERNLTSVETWRRHAGVNQVERAPVYLRALCLIVSTAVVLFFVILSMLGVTVEWIMLSPLLIALLPMLYIGVSGRKLRRRI